MTPVLVQSLPIGWCWTTVSMMDAVISGSSQIGLCLTVNTCGCGGEAAPVGAQEVGEGADRVLAPVTVVERSFVRRRHGRRSSRWSDQRAASSSASSAAVRTRSVAARESRIVSGRLAPGMGTTTGDLASIQARHTRCGLTPWASATWANGA